MKIPQYKESMLLEISAQFKLQDLCMSHQPPIVWREDRTHDYGFDGEIELTKEDKEKSIFLTGQILKVVIKATSKISSGKSLVQMKTQQLAYYKSCDFNILIFLYESTTDELFFKSLKDINVKEDQVAQTIIFNVDDKINSNSEWLSNYHKIDEAPVVSMLADDNKIPNTLDVTFHQELETDLKACKAGKGQWKKYENICIKAIESIFRDSFRNYHSITQSRNHNGLDIKDLVVPNRSKNQFWNEVRQDYQARNIIFEFKNYVKPIGKTQLIQVSHYLKKKSYGRFGIIICRNGLSKNGVEVQKEILRDDDKMILVLSDVDILELVKQKYHKNQPELILEKMKTELELSL
jgi:hypothetical protein